MLLTQEVSNLYLNKDNFIKLGVFQCAQKKRQSL